MAEPRSSEIREGFVRQRRSLVAASLVLLAFQEIGAKLDHLEFLGNTIELARPLSVALPLWVGWAYFLVRYYQHFHDTGDSGYRRVVASRQRALARLAAIAKLKRSLHPEPPEDHPNATWSVEVLEFAILDEPPGFWRLKAKGWIHFHDRARPTWSAAQILDCEVVLSPGIPRWGRLRATIWSGINTRYFTEYGLPFLVAALPPLLLVFHRLGWHLVL